MPEATLVLSPRGLSLEDLKSVLTGTVRRIRLSPAVRRGVRRSRTTVDRLLKSGKTLYGVNTGFGRMASVCIPAAQIEQLQENLLRSHAVGIGDPLPPGESRLMLLLSLHTLARGRSGVTEGLVDHLAGVFNAGLAPVIPELGSVGASGDLAPLAHQALILLGEGKAWTPARAARGDFWLRRCRRPPLEGAAVLRAAGLKRYRLRAKEGISLINGTHMMTAVLGRLWMEARTLLTAADLAAAMSLEALRGSLRPFDRRIQALRPHPGQAEVAANVRRLLAGSAVLASHRNCSKVQDQYSLRCVPQVHGAVRDAVRFVEAVLLREANSVTDNPLVFPEQSDVLSGGNFHGQPVAQAADVLALTLTTLGNICERRIESMVNPDLSGLPPFLTRNQGLQSGMMMAQVVAAALASENKVYAHPASVDTVPTSANKEDHVSMGPAAVRKCRQVVHHVRTLLGIEVLCAARGLDFLIPLRPGHGVEAARRALRRSIPFRDEDRVLSAEIECAAEHVADGSLVRAAETAAGPLV